MIWKSHALFNKARLEKDIDGVLEAADLRKENAKRFQNQYIEGKNFLYAECGYAFSTYCIMLLDEHIE